MNQDSFAKKNIIPLLANKHLHFCEGKTPFNYINYWNYINDEYFQPVTEKAISNTAQIVHKIVLNGNIIFNFLIDLYIFYRTSRNPIQAYEPNKCPKQNGINFT